MIKYKLHSREPDSKFLVNHLKKKRKSKDIDKTHFLFFFAFLKNKYLDL